MSHNKNFRLSILAFAAAAAMPAVAQQPQYSWYGGFSLGQSKTDHDFVTNRESAITDAQNIATSFDDKDGSWKATLGYRFTPMFAVEVNYADYGSVRSDTTFDVAGGNSGRGAVAIDREVKGFGIDGLLMAPIGPLTVFGRVGAFRGETKSRAVLSGDTIFSDGTPGVERVNKSTETSVKYGAGLDWNFHPNVTARLEYERVDKVGKKFESGVSGTTGEAAIDSFMLGVFYRF